MMAAEDESAQIRSVALQNAQVILAARQRVEHEIAADRERLRITLASIGDGVISTDVDGRVTFLNGVAETLTGWSQAEAAGRDLTDVFRVVAAATRRPLENLALRAVREGTIAGPGEDSLLLARDGTERWIDDSAAPMWEQPGVPMGTVLVFRDVTERKAAHEAMARLAAIVESSDDAIVSKDLDGKILSWNAGAERIFGYSSGEAVGRSITMLIPSERLDEERMILGRIRRGERVEPFETIRVTKDGRKINISLTTSPVRDDAGRVVAASKVARDITAKKRAERRAQRLLKREREHARENVRLNRELRNQDRRKDEFLALLAHELRNPLAPIRNALQMMRLTGDDRVVVAESRGIMERQLGHMVRLIDDLLDVARINQNKLELRRAQVLLDEIVSDAVDAARPLIESWGHHLTVALPAEPLVLDADFTRVAQILSNLLTNAAKYTDRGGNIWLTAHREEDQAVISVRDSGIGIPTDAVPRIFDMFSQVDRTIERSTGGLGIGLSIVKGLAEMHGGTVEVDSPGLGRGSTFTVRLPLHGQTAAAVPSAKREEELPPPSARRVLIVDDSRDAALSMAKLLSLLGSEVQTAHDGLEAVARAAEFRPEVILMDVGMPRLNGYEATRRIRAQPWAADVTIVALTGWGQEADRALSTEAGCNGHLVKPVNLSDLERLLADVGARMGQESKSSP
jgi:PAS domain S-box-containing protein